MNNRTRSTFQGLFEQELHLGANQICKECDAQIRHPLLPWLVGKDFTDATERILFVGKPHRGTPGKILQSGIIDPTGMVSESLWDSGSPYWRYTREVAEILYGESAVDHIAFTNLIKCTNVSADDGESTSVDQTTYKMGECCIRRLEVIWREISHLQPRTIVFYTYGLFRDLLQEVPIAAQGSLRDITHQDHSVQCRNKRLGWWERSCKTNWTDNLRILVMGHPERMGRPKYVQQLSNWLRPNQ